MGKKEGERKDGCGLMSMSQIGRRTSVRRKTEQQDLAQKRSEGPQKREGKRGEEEDKVLKRGKSTRPTSEMGAVKNRQDRWKTKTSFSTRITIQTQNKHAAFIQKQERGIGSFTSHSCCFFNIVHNPNLYTFLTTEKIRK